MLKKSLLIFIGIEFIHYCYLTYKLNYSKRTKNKITDKNIKEVLSSNVSKSYLKIDNNSHSFNLNQIYKYFLQDWKLALNNHPRLITPYLLVTRIYYTNHFLYNIYQLDNLGFQLNITPSSIFFIRSNKNFKKLIVFHTGILGNLHHMIKFVKELSHDYTIIISIFRSNVNTLFWSHNESDLDDHITQLNELVKSFNDIIMISHSFGSFILESLYKYNNSIEKNISKEILIQPGNILSTGLIFLSSLEYNYFSYINYISKYSKYFIHNTIFAYTVKTIAGLSSLMLIKDLSGFRFEPKNIPGYLILSDSDPLINTKNSHPFSDEINLIFPSHKIIINEGYHGLNNDTQTSVINCLKEFL
jgi:hypothetical protein